jgi:hypothetical protein
MASSTGLTLKEPISICYLSVCVRPTSNITICTPMTLIVAALKAKIQIKTILPAPPPDPGRIRARTGLKPPMSLRKWQSGPSPGTLRGGGRAGKNNSQNLQSCSSPSPSKLQKNQNTAIAHKSCPDGVWGPEIAQQKCKKRVGHLCCAGSAPGSPPAPRSPKDIVDFGPIPARIRGNILFFDFDFGPWMGDGLLQGWNLVPGPRFS